MRDRDVSVSTVVSIPVAELSALAAAVLECVQDFAEHVIERSGNPPASIALMPGRQLADIRVSVDVVSPRQETPSPERPVFESVQQQATFLCQRIPIAIEKAFHLFASQSGPTLGALAQQQLELALIVNSLFLQQQ